MGWHGAGNLIADEFFESGLNRVSFFEDDFRGELGTFTYALADGWKWTGGPPVATGAGQDGAHPGIVELTTGGSSTGSNRLLHSTGSAVGGSLVPDAAQDIVSEWMVQLPTLSTPGERFVFDVGYGLSPSTVVTPAGIFFEYNEAVSPNWQLGAANGGPRSLVVSAVPVVAGAWYRLRLTKAPGTLSWAGSVNGTAVGPVASNLPTSAMPYDARVVKSVGTTARVARLDYFWERIRWAAGRAP